MRCCILGSALLVLACAASADTRPADPIRLSLSWDMTTDAQGHVTRLDAIKNDRADKVPQIRERLEQAVRGWNFIPGTVNGEPAPSVTRLSLAVSVVPVDDDSVRLRIDSARTGGRTIQMIPPHYPKSAIKEHVTGMVVLRVDYDANGVVTAAVRDPEAPKANQLLVEAAVAAAKQWKFAPELVAGHGVPGSTNLPICFSLHVSRPANPPPCEWTPKGQPIPLGEGESLAINPVVKLTTEVEGRTL